MTKKKHESNDYTDITTRTDILVHDLAGKAHTFYPKDVYSLSTLEAGERYLLEYRKCGSMHRTLIGKKQCNMIKYIIMQTKGTLIL